MREATPEMCADGEHRFGQLGRCRKCGYDQAKEMERRARQADRKTGGAGARTNPLSDGDYRRQRDKLGGR